MDSPIQIDQPQLAAPGAGLPGYELAVARLQFRFLRMTTTCEQATDSFCRYRDPILLAISGLDKSRLAARSLIKRLRGLEDSSRYWSVFMSLDHLRITNLAFADVVTSLTQDVVPPTPASTASVKPDPAVQASVIDDFKASCEAFLIQSEAVQDLHTRAVYAHPWFGELNAVGWHVLAGLHMGLHQTQMVKIIESI